MQHMLKIIVYMRVMSILILEKYLAQVNIISFAFYRILV